MTSLPLYLSRNGFDYCACYCEENIFRLCLRIDASGVSLADCKVVFVSGLGECVPLWRQREGKGRGVVFWDYHVFLVAPSSFMRSEVMRRTTYSSFNTFNNEEEFEHYVFDFDSLLPFPTPASLYLPQTFRPELTLPAKHEHYFRVIDADSYLDHFTSDRRHMRRAEAAGGGWLSPPPAWDSITGRKVVPVDDARGSSNLEEYRDMRSQGEHRGTIMSKQDFFSSFCRNPMNSYDDCYAT